ncbi:pectate lyase [Uliginosibacterium sp. H3]|uniref:Pectate lyase n=1 Tax=Uliginosibacterium silvisoli TaxID=3114758 RepID=A0ABU6K0T4_9RHOO|nr:pectate lyase [Uliginosibacterium sp. H3]
MKSTGFLLGGLMLALSACGGGGGDSASAPASSSSSSSVASSARSSSSSAAAVTTFLPVSGETAAYADTRLQITFDSAPTLGSSGYIKVYKKSDDSLVDTISLNVFSTGSSVAPSYTSSTLTSHDTQTALAKANVEIDKLGSTSTLTQWRYIFYKPVAISGNTATIRLHDGVLSPSTAYYVQIDNGVLTGNLSGAAFAGIANKTSWTFTTRAAPVSTTSVTVDDDGTTADFRTVQGAINWLTTNCGGSSVDACNSVSVAKTITVKNGTYDGELFIRSLNNLSIQGESRAGVVVRSENFEQYNPGTGGSATALPYSTPTNAEVGGNRPRLNGGRAVLLVEGADLLQLVNFTLQNTHVKNVWEGATVSINNQAETIYFNSATLTGSRLVGKQMNFYSTQDTIQVKGWVWLYQSLVKGDVDFVWGSPFAALVEETELRTIVDTTNTALGGYVIESRTGKGFPGFVVLNSQLTRESGVPDNTTMLGRQASNFSSTATYCNTQFTGSGSFGNANLGCNNVAYINTKMDTHIATAGWLYSNAPPITTPSTTEGYRESGSMTLAGGVLDVSGRSLTYASTSIDLSGLNTRTKVFASWNSNAGWVPVP